MKIDLWTRYSKLGASSRLRFFQYVPLLAERGIECGVHNFFDDRYLQELYSGKRRAFSGVVKSYCRRWRDMRAAERGVPAVIEYELLPFLPYCMEKGFLKKHPYILNFDDAVDLHYRKNRFLRSKYPLLLSNASGIIVANEVLYKRFCRFNPNIIKIPTVPPEAVKPGRNKPERLTLVWTGTPVTYEFLYARRKALALAAEQVDYELLIVGAPDAPQVSGVKCRYLPWSQENECAALEAAHAGIMPLPDTPFARGKSAYKLICFLRAGLPGIASPVGENCRVIENGVNGFLAGSDQEWAAAIAVLADENRRSTLMEAAEKSSEKYALAPGAEKLAGFIRQTFEGT